MEDRLKRNLKLDITTFLHHSWKLQKKLKNYCRLSEIDGHKEVGRKNFKWNGDDSYGYQIKFHRLHLIQENLFKRRASLQDVTPEEKVFHIKNGVKKRKL